MRKLIAVPALVALVAGVVAVSAFGSTTTVKWKLPVSKTVTIHKGSTVKWSWADSSTHSVVGPGLSASRTEKTGKGKSVSRTFKKKGTFTYICGIHGSSMKTKVKVV